MRHAFRILEELGAECDRLGVRVVDVHGERGPPSEFLAKIVHYIEARERECARPTLTDAERFVLREVMDIYADEDDVASNEIAAVIDGLLERTK